MFHWIARFRFRNGCLRGKVDYHKRGCCLAVSSSRRILSVVRVDAMKKWGYIFCIMFFLFGLASCSGEQSKGSSSETIKIAQQFIELLQKGDMVGAANMFDATMKTALPPDKLQEVWNQVKTQCGDLKSQNEMRVEKIGNSEVVYISCAFEKTALEAKVVFDSRQRISGLWFAPKQPNVEYKSPAYIKHEEFVERPVTVGDDKEWELPGTLTLPKGKGPFPALVLVHGSGPQDRDETIGPNKPFKDLAWGLASQGIAVLRYEKRTKYYTARIVRMSERMTVKDETIDDALEAVKTLRKIPEIDQKRIFVLGHSLGGMLIPRIAKGNSDIAGVVILAGTTRPLEDVILDQTAYLFSLKNQPGADQSPVEKIRAQVAKVKDKNLSSETPASELPFSIPASYWLDLRDYKPAEAAKHLTQPMLILQGGRDYQVTYLDYDGWKEALVDKKNVTFKLYPKLNHLFVEGEGKSSPDEYDKAGNVAEIVVEDIAAWIKAQ